MCENSILSEIEELRVDGSGVRVTLEKIPSNVVGVVEFEEMKKDQAKFNKEVLETLRLMRQEIKDNQNQIKIEIKNMKEEQKKVMEESKKESPRLILKEMKSVQEKLLKEQNKSEGKVLNKLQLVMDNQKKMNEKHEKNEEQIMKKLEESKQKTMNSLGLTITRIANVQNEQAKVLKEVEAIRNDVQTMKRDSDNMDALKRTENHPSSQKITFYLLFNDRKDVFEYLPTDTIADVKREIAIRMEVPVHQQMIYFKSDTECKNHKTLHECGLQNGSIATWFRVFS